MVNAVGSLLDGVIRLESDGVVDEDVRAFIRVFESAWNRILPQHQAVIESYWRDRVAPEDCRGKPNTKETYDPHILVFDDTSPDNKGVPEVLFDGFVILFPARLLADMGAEFAVLAVAHELAHISFYAISEPNHWPDHKTSETYDAAEHLVDDRLLQWGFDYHTIQKLDAWMTVRGFARFCGTANHRRNDRASGLSRKRKAGATPDLDSLNHSGAGEYAEGRCLRRNPVHSEVAKRCSNSPFSGGE